jgi:hypothetical protein
MKPLLAGGIAAWLKREWLPAMSFQANVEKSLRLGCCIRLHELFY